MSKISRLVIRVYNNVIILCLYNEYVIDFLTNYASDIQKTEEELKQQASQLSVGY